jgi:hypothetical protein
MPNRSRRSKGRTAPGSPLPSDLEEDVDKFHRQREQLTIDVEEDGLSDDSLDRDEEAVLDVSGASDGNSSSEELDTDDEIERDTRFGKCKSIFDGEHRCVACLNMYI